MKKSLLCSLLLLTAILYQKNCIAQCSPTPSISVNTGTFANTCPNIGYTYTTQSGMTGYSWIVSEGGTINSGANTNSVSVSWTTSGAKTISVNYTNGSGCTPIIPTVQNITVRSVPAATV